MEDDNSSNYMEVASVDVNVDRLEEGLSDRNLDSRNAMGAENKEPSAVHNVYKNSKALMQNHMLQSKKNNPNF